MAGRPPTVQYEIFAAYDKLIQLGQEPTTKVIADMVYGDDVNGPNKLRAIVGRLKRYNRWPYDKDENKDIEGETISKIINHLNTLNQASIKQIFIILKNDYNNNELNAISKITELLGKLDLKQERRVTKYIRERFKI